MKNNIEIFNYLHDTGLSNLLFDFQNKEVSIDFLIWDDIMKKEEILTIKLLGVSKFISDYPKDIEFNVIGCHEVICTLLDNNQYNVTFLFDFLKQAVAWKVEMNFMEVEIKGGLSDKAFNYKYNETNS